MRLLRLFFAGMLVTIVLVLPHIADAATPCSCVCNAPTGAITGQTTTTDKAAEVCPKNCQTQSGGGTYKNCATDLTTLPENNAKCYTQEECEKRTVPVNGEDKPSSWGSSQPQECIAGRRYCYNPPIPVNLSVAISTLKNPQQALSIGEYIVAMYDLLLPICALAAVVLLMIAGLQWVTAAGNQERISKAKDRITKAITGLVLVMGAYSIVYLVDPRLTSFEDLKLPIIKGAEFLDENSMCETFVKNGFTVVNTSRAGIDPKNTYTGEDACGARCKIDKLPVGKPFAGDIEVGQEFFWGKCAGSSACIIKGTTPEDKKGLCAACWDINPMDDKGLGIPPSSSSCSRLDPLDELYTENKGVPATQRPYARCFATSDSDVVTGLGSALTGSTCALFYFHCDEITASQKCRDYGQPFVYSGPAPSPPAGNSIIDSFSSALKNGAAYLLGLGPDLAYIYDIDTGDVTYQSICSEDPCGIGCAWDSSKDPAERCVDDRTKALSDEEIMYQYLTE